MQDRDKPEWTGTATELHKNLQEKAATLNINIRDKSWPKSPNSLSRKLNLIKTNLREIGIELDKCYLDENKKSRGIKIRKISSEPSEPTETQNHAQLTSDDSDDIDNGSRIISTDNEISSEKTPENHAQNGISDDTDDTDDILHTSQGQDDASSSNHTRIAASARVINIKHDPTAYYVYIGRANKQYGLEESQWANPYKIGKDGTRQEVIEKYRAYIKGRPDLLASLSDLEGQPLGCWCSPEPCHGDVLIELLQQSTSQSKNEESSRDTTIPKSLYKFSKGVWKCRNCFQNGDLQSMIDHVEHCSHDKDLEI